MQDWKERFRTLLTHVRARWRSWRGLTPHLAPGVPGRRVEHIQVGQPDWAGKMILNVFAVQRDHWAVYLADSVYVQYADDADLADAQRKHVSALLGPRLAELRGLLEQLPERGRRVYHGVLAQALIAALQDNEESAKQAMDDGIRRLTQDLEGRRRADFVIFGMNSLLLTFLPLLLAVAATAWYLDVRLSAQREAAVRAHAIGFGSALLGGLLGAAFSAGIGLRTRALVLAPDHRTNRLDAGLRLAVGATAGVVLYLALTVGGPLFIGVGSPAASARPGTWPAILLFGFLAGFAERLVPGLLGKAADRFGNTEERNGETRDE